MQSLRHSIPAAKPDGDRTSDLITSRDAHSTEPPRLTGRERMTVKIVHDQSPQRMLWPRGIMINLHKEYCDTGDSTCNHLITSRTHWYLACYFAKNEWNMSDDQIISNFRNFPKHLGLVLDLHVYVGKISKIADVLLILVINLTFFTHFWQNNNMPSSCGRISIQTTKYGKKSAWWPYWNM